MSAEVVGLVCARGGSKGVPRKNLRALGGKPLIGWSIELGRACPSIDRMIVSTEDGEIAAVARAYGAETPFVRPAELARDDSPEWLVWRHAMQALSDPPAFFVSLPATSPLRAVEDVEGCIETLRRHPEADMVITVTPSARNPYFNMVVFEDGWTRLAARPERPIHRRQDAPPVYDITTVAYAVRTEFVLRADRLFDGRVKAVIVPAERALDIDTELDFAFAEFMLSRAAPPA